MAQNAEVICNPEGKTGRDTETYKVGIASAIIGMVAYIFLVVPILTLTIVGALNLSGDYVMAVAIACVFAGIYVSEKLACRNI